MFRTTSPQRSIFSIEYMLDPEKRQRLENSWAKPFRDQVLPLINEEEFAEMYCNNNGAPNKSVRTLVSLHLLKDQYDLTDEETIQMFEWNNQWHYALDINPNEAHVCRKTMHNFRTRVIANEKGRNLFDQIADGVANLGKIDLSIQRTDSTHIVSNMMILNRLGLFVKTIEGFLSKLERTEAPQLQELPQRFFDRYIDRKGYFADSKSSKAQRRIEDCAKDLWYLIDHFCEDPKISKLEQYKKLKRLFRDQCKIVDGENPEEERVALKEPKSDKPEDHIPADSMQSPSDEEATYGHKGKGYEAQMSETCSEENPFEVITDAAVSDSCGSDQTETIPTLERLEEAGRKPETFNADAGFVSADNIQGAEEMEVDLLGPIAGGPEKEDRLHLRNFEFNEAGEVICCPEGHSPLRKEEDKNTQEPRVHYFFDRATCEACPQAPQCPVIRDELRQGQSKPPSPSKKRNPPKLTTTEKDRIIAQRKQRQETDEFKETYKIRSGIEATNSEFKRCHGGGKLRVRSRLRVALAVYLKTAAINVKRFLSYALSRGKVCPKTALSRA